MKIANTVSILSSLALFSILPTQAHALACMPVKVGAYEWERLLPRLKAEIEALLPLFLIVTCAVLSTYGYRRFRSAEVNSSRYLKAFILSVFLMALAVVVIGPMMFRTTGGYCANDYRDWMRDLETLGWAGIYCLIGCAIYGLARQIRK